MDEKFLETKMTKIFRCIFLFAYLSMVVTNLVGDKKIYILPPGGYENEKLFDLSDKRLNRDDCVKHFYDLRTTFKKFGYRLVTAKITDNLSDATIILTSGVSPDIVAKLAKYPGKKFYAHIWEPHCVQPTSYVRANHLPYAAIFIMDDRFVGTDKRYVKLHYPHPYLYMIDSIVPFQAKKFCTLISGNKSSRYPHELYSEREHAIRFFEKYPELFEFYGHGWRSRGYRNYKGEVFEKVDVLKNYKFCICYENSSDEPGYITEKIFDCFHAGCVPIYYGAPNVTNYIPDNCFIDFRKFDKNYDKLHTYLCSITSEQYEQFLSNIRLYLKSAAAQKFSFEYMIHVTLRAMLPEYKASIAFDKNTVELMAILDHS